MSDDRLVSADRSFDQRPLAIAGFDGVVGRVTVIGAIGRKLIDRGDDLVKQRLHLRGVASTLVGHDVSDDFAAVGIQRQVQFAPASTGFGTVLFFQSLARAVITFSEPQRAFQEQDCINLGKIFKIWPA